MSDILVNVKPINPDPKKVHSACNVIRMNATYSKGRGIEASAFPAETKNGIMSIVITSGEYIKLEDAGRLNRKRVEALRETVRQQVEAKAGPAWDLAMKVCERCGLTPVN